MNETVLFTGTDHAQRSWFVSTWPHDGQQIARFVCWHATGRGKSLDQTAAWGPDGWDMQRWFPRSPSPVPEPILKEAERRLKELVRQQQAPVAWCRSDEFLAAAAKRQSFNGWREQHYNCDMALYAVQLPAAALTILHAIGLAKGCHDYSGGYVGESLEAFHGGIDTVVDVLQAAVGPWDSQTRAVFAAGSEPIAQPVAPSEDPSDFQTLHGIPLDMVETLRPIVIPQILGVLSRAIEQSPAPTTHTPLDLDALLSPEGAYEPGTGAMAGAQLLTGRHGERGQWWVPIVGCDTLDNLLDQIRSRILPHLRPPIAGIDVPGPDGDYGGLQELCDACGVDVRIGAPLLKRAREAWNAAAQAPQGVTLEELIQSLPPNFRDAQAYEWAAARAGYLQHDHAFPASDGEREELIEWLTHMAQAGLGGRDELNAAAAATLLRNPCATPVPAAVPVEVSESPWEREGWCDANGKLWCFFDDSSESGWQYRLPRPTVYDTHYLPHWAIPIPGIFQSPRGGEVQ